MRSLTRHLEKLRGRTLGELRERTGQAVSAHLERRGLSTMSRLGPASLHPAPPDFFGARSNADASALTSPALLPTADRILAGRFDLLGHPDLSFGHPIDWHLDPVAGKRSPRIHWSRIPYLDAAVVGDHKVVWELNRHQHFFVLGRAYRLTGDEKYARCFAEHLSSWMDENPPKIGINWASSLEIAYRAIAWLWAFELFRESAALTPELLTRAIGFLHVHGRHLERYLSTWFSPNTHLTGEALGLLYLGVMLPELARADRWRTRGWDILVEQLPKQIHPDGVYFEQASYYHRYTVDIYLHAILLARQQGLPVPPAMLERLDLAVRHLADLTRPDGTIPIIGDDDGGRLVWLEERDFMDVRSPLAVASVVLDRPDYAAIAGGSTEEVFWLLGPEAVSTVDRWAGSSPRLERRSTLYPTGGYAIFRDGWGADADHAVVDCGPLGTLNCGHAHSDALSMEVAVAGCPVLVDPGTFTYTSSADDRDRFRHSAAHNTVTVDGQSASVPSGPFSWAIRTDAKAERWWSGSRTDYFVGSHPGFERLPDPVLHRRTVLFVRGAYWLVVDTIVARGAHQSVARWHAAIGADVASLSPTSAVVSVPCAHGRTGLFLGVAGDAGPLEWGEDWVSPSYGDRTLAPCVRVVGRGSGRKNLVTVLAPVRSGEAIDVGDVECDGERERGRAVRVNRQDMRDLLILGGSGVTSAGGVAMVGEAALVRRSAVNGDIVSIALFGSAARLTADGLTMTAKGGAEAVRAGAGWTVEGEGAITIHQP
jgi:hypothetical protein